ncbi:MAG: translation initiation factor IF-2 [Chitinophagales bacterium]
MSEVKKAQRLAKVAKDLGVGTKTLTDFLTEKGYEVKNNPGTKISEEMHTALLMEFQKDAAAKEKADDINLGASNREEVSISDAKKSSKEKAKEDSDEVFINSPGVTEEVVEKEEKPASKEEEKETPKKEEKSEEKTNLKAPKVIGNIDLDADKKKKAAEKEEKKEEEKEKKKKEEKSTEEVAKKKEADQEKKEEIEEAHEIKTQKTNLQGPKVLGKIDITDKFEERKKKEKKEAAEKKEGAKKKRRKRFIKSTDKPGTSSRKGPDKKKRSDEPQEVSEKEIEEKIKATLAKLGGSQKGGKTRSKLRRQKRQDIAAKTEEEELQHEIESQTLQVTEFISVSELASMMDTTATEVISKCMQLGIIVSINQRLDAEVIELVADEFGFEVKFIDIEDQEEDIIEEEEDDPKDLVERAPIVTVMGHVDHGKTSLLDHVRKANVASGEAGGITQHIGAYEVITEDEKRVVFLDTPGHEAFTAMRARGAKATDVAVIVIAADDSVMPQTKEAISHAQAASVPMIFAINKIDKPGSNPEKIKEQLAGMNLLVEDWGGKFQCQEISAKQGLNIDKLLEKILLESELLELKSNPKKPATGTIIEASLDRGRGYVSTVLVQNGTLNVGDVVTAGVYYGKVKAMFNERGERKKEAGPSTAVQLLGFNGAPQAGEVFRVVESDQEAKQVTQKREQIMREQGLRTKKHITLDEIGRRLALGNFKELNVIIKGDVDGSIEALSDALMKLSTDEIQVGVVHKGVGQITESDVLLASASDAIIIGFQVRPSQAARSLAEKENIEIRHYSIIYQAIDELKTAMEGMLEPTIQENITGNLEVKEIFKITKVGTVGGCEAIDGKIYKNEKIRVIREGIVVHSGELESLKRFKDEVKEVVSGQECGIKIKNYNDLQKGDIIECYQEKEVKRKL